MDDDEDGSDTDTGSISSQEVSPHISGTRPNVPVPSSSLGPPRPPMRPRRRFTTFQSEGALAFEAGASARNLKYINKKTPEVGADGQRRGTI